MDNPSLEALAEAVQIQVQALCSNQNGARARLLEAIESLKTAVEPASLRMSRIRSQVLQNVALLMAEEMHLIDQIVALNGKEVTAFELSHTINYDLGLIASNDLVFPIGARIRSHVSSLKQSDSSQSLRLGPYQFTYLTSVWESIRCNPEIKRAFDDNLAGRSRLHPIRWFEKYPAAVNPCLMPSATADEVLVVDVGGNQGYDLASFAGLVTNRPEDWSCKIYQRP
ncbi:MAG: hypothetical protein Q9222_001940 [Ikaeria aurantiellina]